MMAICCQQRMSICQALSSGTTYRFPEHTAGTRSLHITQQSMALTTKLCHHIPHIYLYTFRTTPVPGTKHLTNIQQMN